MYLHKPLHLVGSPDAQEVVQPVQRDLRTTSVLQHRQFICLVCGSVPARIIRLRQDRFPLHHAVCQNSLLPRLLGPGSVRV